MHVFHFKVSRLIKSVKLTKERVKILKEATAFSSDQM